jgi:protein tyrosine/serine phosphatase
MYSRSVRVTAVLAALLMAAVAAAETKSNKVHKTAIKNFGCINENYFRGAQPEGKDYEALASMGVKTVIDLERDGEANEQKLVESAGMKFVRFPMTTTDRPDPKVVGEFLSIVNNPTNQPVFVHCHGGRHRTGVMTAIYRLTHDSWTADQAFAEMKEYEFGKGFGHGALKEYVFDYFAGLNREIVGTGKESVKATAGGGPKN